VAPPPQGGQVEKKKESPKKPLTQGRPQPTILNLALWGRPGGRKRNWGNFTEGQNQRGVKRLGPCLYTLDNGLWHRKGVPGGKIRVIPD